MLTHLCRSPNKQRKAALLLSHTNTKLTGATAFPQPMPVRVGTIPLLPPILQRTGADCQHVCPNPSGVQKLKRAKVIAPAPNVLREQCCGLRPHTSISNLQGNEYSLNLHPVANELCGLGRVNRGNRKQLALGVKM